MKETGPFQKYILIRPFFFCQIWRKGKNNFALEKTLLVLNSSMVLLNWFNFESTEHQGFVHLSFSSWYIEYTKVGHYLVFFFEI